MLLVKSMSFRNGGFAHRPCVQEMICGIDEPYDDTEEYKTLWQQVYVQYPAEQSSGYHSAECDVEAEKIEDAIEAHDAKVVIQAALSWSVG